MGATATGSLILLGSTGRPDAVESCPEGMMAGDMAWSGGSCAWDESALDWARDADVVRGEVEVAIRTESEVLWRDRRVIADLNMTPWRKPSGD